MGPLRHTVPSLVPTSNTALTFGELPLVRTLHAPSEVQGGLLPYAGTCDRDEITYHSKKMSLTTASKAEDCRHGCIPSFYVWNFMVFVSGGMTVLVPAPGRPHPPTIDGPDRSFATKVKASRPDQRFTNLPMSEAGLCCVGMHTANKHVGLREFLWLSFA